MNGSPAVYLQEKHFGIERELSFAVHCRPSLSRKVFFGERVAKGTTGEPDRQVEVELDHEQAFTDHLCKLPWVDSHMAGSCALMTGLILDSKEHDPAGEPTSAARPASRYSKSIEGIVSVMYITVGRNHSYVLGRRKARRVRTN